MDMLWDMYYFFESRAAFLAIGIIIGSLFERYIQFHAAKKDKECLLIEEGRSPHVAVLVDKEIREEADIEKECLPNKKVPRGEQPAEADMAVTQVIPSDALAREREAENVSKEPIDSQQEENKCENPTETHGNKEITETDLSTSDEAAGEAYDNFKNKRNSETNMTQIIESAKIMSSTQETSDKDTGEEPLVPEAACSKEVILTEEPLVEGLAEAITETEDPAIEEVAGSVPIHEECVEEGGSKRVEETTVRVAPKKLTAKESPEPTEPVPGIQGLSLKKQQSLKTTSAIETVTASTTASHEKYVPLAIKSGQCSHGCFFDSLQQQHLQEKQLLQRKQQSQLHLQQESQQLDADENVLLVIMLKKCLKLGKERIICKVAKEVINWSCQESSPHSIKIWKETGENVLITKVDTEGQLLAAREAILDKGLTVSRASNTAVCVGPTTKKYIDSVINKTKSP